MSPNTEKTRWSSRCDRSTNSKDLFCHGGRTWWNGPPRIVFTTQTGRAHTIVFNALIFELNQKCKISSFKKIILIFFFKCLRVWSPMINRYCLYSKTQDKMDSSAASRLLCSLCVIVVWIQQVWSLLEDWRELRSWTFSKQICLYKENIYVSNLMVKLFHIFGIRYSLLSMLSTKVVSHWEVTASD